MPTAKTLKAAKKTVRGPSIEKQLRDVQAAYEGAKAHRETTFRKAYNSGMSYQVIADEVGTTKSNIWGILHRKSNS